MQSPNFPPPTVRSSNFELLRIFCMLSIVAVHYVWHGGSAASGSNIAAAYFLGNFAQIGVACFVLIGAWFLIDKEFSITRIFNLSKQITFYSLSIALLLFIIGMASYTDIIKNAMPIIFKRYWFLTPYVFLLFLHPFLNYVLNACSKKQIRFLCISLFIAVSVIPTIFIVTDPFGFNIFRFILLYLIAYAIKKECIRIEFKNNLLNFITSITVAFGMYSLSLLALRWNYTDFASLYPKQMSSVPVMISSVYLFLGIKHLTFKSNFINKLSAHTLAVYLISEHTCLFKWFWTDILRTDKLWNAGIFEYLGYSSLIMLSVFVSCILIDYIIKNTIYKILPNTPKFLINIEHYFKIKT